jgi:hypothetical protein
MRRATRGMGSGSQVGPTGGNALPSRISEAAMLSQMSVYGTPIFSHSQAVSRPPCD